MILSIYTQELFQVKLHLLSSIKSFNYRCSYLNVLLLLNLCLADGRQFSRRSDKIEKQYGKTILRDKMIIKERKRRTVSSWMNQ